MDGCRRFTEILLDWKPFDFYSDSKVLSYGKEKEVGIQALKTFRECFLSGRIRLENDQIQPNLPDRPQVYRMAVD